MNAQVNDGLYGRSMKERRENGGDGDGRSES